MSDKKKQITYTPTEDIKMADAQYLGSNDSIAIFEVLKRTKYLSHNMQSWLLGINLYTGKKAYEISTENQKFKFLPMNVSTLQGGSNYFLMGPYYDRDDRVEADKTLGLGIWMMNNKGEIVAQKYNSWATDIGKYLKTDSRGRVDGLGYIFFHKIIQTQDGNIFAVGEGYKRTASAAGIAFTALNALGGGYSGASVTKMTITDLLLLQMDNQFTVKAATIYAKNHNQIELPAGGDFVSPHLLALMIKAWDGFDYAFTRTDRDHTSFAVCYTDYERSKDYKGMTFHSISYFNNNINQDKINLATKASKMRVMPAKTGSVMITEYFKKDKRLDVHLEKVN